MPVTFGGIYTVEDGPASGLVTVTMEGTPALTVELDAGGAYLVAMPVNLNFRGRSLAFEIVEDFAGDDRASKTVQAMDGCDVDTSRDLSATPGRVMTLVTTAGHHRRRLSGGSS